MSHVNFDQWSWPWVPGDWGRSLHDRVSRVPACKLSLRAKLKSDRYWRSTPESMRCLCVLRLSGSECCRRTGSVATCLPSNSLLSTVIHVTKGQSYVIHATVIHVSSLHVRHRPSKKKKNRGGLIGRRNRLRHPTSAVPRTSGLADVHIKITFFNQLSYCNIMEPLNIKAKKVEHWKGVVCLLYPFCSCCHTVESWDDCV